MNRGLIVFLVLFCCSCIKIGSDPKPARYYLLQPLADAQTFQLPKKLKITLQPIDFPSYIDRPQVVSNSDQNQIHIADFDRWAEPLRDNLSRILQENLARQLPNAVISTLPWPASEANAISVKLTVIKFDGTLGANTNVQVRWTISKNQQHLHQGKLTAKIPIGNDYPDLAQGLNQALDRLSVELARSIAEQYAKN